MQQGKFLESLTSVILNIKYINLAPAHIAIKTHKILTFIR